MKHNMSMMSLPAFVFLLVVTGCGGGTPRPEGMPALHPTTLSFTQNNAPLVGATVTLYPQASEMQRWGAGGITNEQGSVVFYTLGQYPGVPAGQYKIVVNKTDRDPTTFVGEFTEERQDEYEKAEAKRKSYRLVERDYSDPAKTPLEIEITAGKNEKTFDVGKAVREGI